MKWIEVVVKTSHEYEDLVSDILYQAGAGGLAIEDPNDIIELSQKQDDWDYFNADLMDMVDEGICIKAYFSETNNVDSIIEFIRTSIEYKPLETKGISFGKVILNELDDEDWAQSWKQFYKPRRIGERILIKPTWHDFDVKADDIVIELDPGMAFGTGTHETTIMCIEALEGLVRPGKRVYDIGCGSGILSIVAAKLGASQVVGVDLDPTCVRVSRENIKINNLTNKIQVIQGNLLDLVDGHADIIVSNIVAEVIIGMAGDLEQYLNQNGYFIGSGIIVEKIESVKTSLTNAGFEIVDVRTKNDWACIVAWKNR